MAKRKAGSGEDRPEDDNAPAKMSVLLTRGIMRQLQEAQARQRIDNLSYFCRLFFRRHLPAYLAGEGDLKGGPEGVLQLPVEDELGEVVLETARQLGMSPADLVRGVLAEHIDEWVEKAEKQQQAFRAMRGRLRGEGQ
jgi:hypothetical protein